MSEPLSDEQLAEVRRSVEWMIDYCNNRGLRRHMAPIDIPTALALIEEVEGYRAQNGGHRILWNQQRSSIDEVVFSRPEMVHVEQMDDRCWWIGVTLDDQREWSGFFIADSKGRMRFGQQESEGVVWEHDDEHPSVHVEEER